MADGRRGMEGRLLRAALWKRRGSVLLAVLAVGIATSVAAALMHLSDDVSRKVGRELRAFGPNLLLVPESAALASDAELGATPQRFLSETAVRERLSREQLDGALLLYARMRVDGEPAQVVGADLDAMRSVHPSWSVSDQGSESWIGVRLADKLGIAEGQRVTLTGAAADSVTLTVGAVLTAGGPADDALWLPLERVQQLSVRPDQVSLAQLRIDASAEVAHAVESRVSGDGIRAVVLHALSRTEAGLLERMQRLMLLVTLAALIAGGLAAFGTLTDLALARRREIALMKSLGARRRDVIRQLLSESLVIGGAGGVAGWLIGVFFAEFIGRQVFHASITLHPAVPFVVLALALGVALLAGLGPIRLALRVEPAAVLKGE